MADYIMADWDDWRIRHKIYIDAEISGPVNVPEEYKGSDHQIDLFSEICRFDITYKESLERIQQTLLILFNYTHGQCLSFTEYLGKFTDRQYHITINTYNN